MSLFRKARAQKRLREYLLTRRTRLVLTALFSEIVGEYGTRPLYKLLGYFSVIGLLRVHSLLGDFTLALKVMESVELNQKVFGMPGNTAHNTTDSSVNRLLSLE